jgi:hypothetical protein
MNFVGEYKIDEKICDQIVDYFESHEVVKKPGTTQAGYNLNIKDSFDSCLFGHHRSVYMKELQRCIDEYRKDYEFCDSIAKWEVVEHVNVQKYIPGQCFKTWHCERMSNNPQSIRRVLVFMTYLNTVDDGGETEFYYQHHFEQPVAGKMVIWPSDWTYLHRGISSPTQTKYILTGWLSHYNDQK